MPRKTPPHCGSAFHFQHCVCGCERQYHLKEVGKCYGIRTCQCEQFRLAAGNMIIEHKEPRYETHEALLKQMR